MVSYKQMNVRYLAGSTFEERHTAHTLCSPGPVAAVVQGGDTPGICDRRIFPAASAAAGRPLRKQIPVQDAAVEQGRRLGGLGPGGGRGDQPQESGTELFPAVLRIHDNWVWIRMRIRGSMPLT
jgi:hypothetical protein